MEGSFGHPRSICVVPLFDREIGLGKVGWFCRGNTTGRGLKADWQRCAKPSKRRLRGKQAEVSMGDRLVEHEINLYGRLHFCKEPRWEGFTK